MSQPTAESTDPPSSNLPSPELFARIRELESELAASQAEMSLWQRRCEEVMKMVSHDLRGPLTLISGHTQGVLARVPNTRADERTALLAISQATYRLDKMLSEVVDCTRLETQNLELNHQLLDVGLILKSVVRKTELRYPGRMIKLEVPRRLPSGWGDQKRIGQIIGSLISNAVVFSAETAPVLVTAANTEARLVIRIADEGAGIADDEMPHLFEKYYRPERLRDPRREGLGLSLTIANGLAALMSASLWATSPGVDRGATFCLALPLSTPAELDDLPGLPDDKA